MKKERKIWFEVCSVWLVVLLLMMTVSAASYKLKVTEEHPFYVVSSESRVVGGKLSVESSTTDDERLTTDSGNWVSAKDLQVGDRLLTDDGKKARITSVERVVMKEEFPVYNLEATPFNDYVMEGDVVVHNSGTLNEIRFKGLSQEEISVFLNRNIDPFEKADMKITPTEFGQNAELISLPSKAPPDNIKDILMRAEFTHKEIDLLTDSERLFYSDVLAERQALTKLNTAEKIAVLELHYTKDSRSRWIAALRKMRANGGRLSNDHFSLYINKGILGESKPLKEYGCLEGSIEAGIQKLSLKESNKRKIDFIQSYYSQFDDSGNLVNDLGITKQQIDDVAVDFLNDNEGFIISIVDRVSRSRLARCKGFNFDDLYPEAQNFLVESILTYDSARGEFTTWAGVQIRFRLMRYMDPKGETNYGKIYRAIGDYLRTKSHEECKIIDFNPNDPDLLEYLNTRFMDNPDHLKQIPSALRKYNGDLKLKSLDSMMDEDGRQILPPDPFANNPCTINQLAEQQKLLDEILQSDLLSQDMKEVIYLVYREDLSITEIANQRSKSHTHIQNLHNRAIIRMKYITHNFNELEQNLIKLDQALRNEGKALQDIALNRYSWDVIKYRHGKNIAFDRKGNLITSNGEIPSIKRLSIKEIAEKYGQKETNVRMDYFMAITRIHKELKRLGIDKDIVITE